MHYENIHIHVFVFIYMYICRVKTRYVPTRGINSLYMRHNECVCVSVRVFFSEMADFFRMLCAVGIP